MNHELQKPILEKHIRILLEADTYPLFNLVCDPKYYPIFELFSNSNTRSSYLPKFGANHLLGVDSQSL